MITKLSIENFKGIRDRVELELRPITLLFGANSAGKSSVLHVLHYAREVFERHNLDADETIAGGKYIDLGGFEHFLHRSDQEHVHDSEKQVKLRIDLDVTTKNLPSFDADIDGLVEQAVAEVDRHKSKVNFDSVRELLYLDFHSFLDGMSTAAVEVTIGWSTVENCPFVVSNKIFINDKVFAEIVSNSSVRGFAVKFSETSPDPDKPDQLKEVSTLDHPCLIRARDAWQGDDQQGVPYNDETLLEVALSFCGDMLSSGGNEIQISGKGDALPGLDSPLNYDLEPFSPSGDEENDTHLAFKINLAGELVLALSDLIIGPCQLIRDNLKQFRYLGPLRDTPPRNFQPPRYSDSSRWSSGLGAWDTLHNGSEQLVDAVGEWLGDPDNLNSGCRVERRTYLELDYGNQMVSSLMARQAFDEMDEHIGEYLADAPTTSRVVVVPDNSGIELRPHDVGIGISQVVPVIVMALDGEERLLAIEQPELHIHPRLQAEIADLFVESMHSLNNRFILETHSEHLILRLLRRIRETAAGKAPANRQLRTDDLAIYYLKQENGSTREMRIDVDVKGEFIQPWPDDFFEIDFYERFSIDRNDEKGQG